MSPLPPLVGEAELQTVYLVPGPDIFQKPAVAYLVTRRRSRTLLLCLRRPALHGCRMAAGLCMAGTAVTLLVTYRSYNDETKTCL